MQQIMFEVDYYSYGYILRDIFSGFPFEKYQWVVDYLSIFYPIGDCSLQVGNYSAEGFEQALRRDIVPEQGRILAYPKGVVVRNSYKEISTYSAFVESPCRLAVLFYDGGYYEFFAKDRDDVKCLMNACAQIKHDALDLIAEEDIYRTIFYV